MYSSHFRPSRAVWHNRQQAVPHIGARAQLTATALKATVSATTTKTTSLISVPKKPPLPLPPLVAQPLLEPPPQLLAELMKAGVVTVKTTEAAEIQL